jgi:tetratricopeptide (TPR) repeat protein
METDRLGYPLATGSPEAAAAYRAGVDLLLSGYPGAEACLGESLRHDPGFALAHAALARHLQIYGRIAEARAAMERARGASSSPRERQHIEILGLSIEGQPARALAALLEHAEAYPRDALPLSLALGAFGLYAFSGRAEHDELRLGLCRRLAPHYGEDWWMLTHLGWSHTEAGRLAEGARITERALELKRDNAHAAHAGTARCGISSAGTTTRPPRSCAASCTRR